MEPIIFNNDSPSVKRTAEFTGLFIFENAIIKKGDATSMFVDVYLENQKLKTVPFSAYQTNKSGEIVEFVNTEIPVESGEEIVFVGRTSATQEFEFSLLLSPHSIGVST